MSTRRTLVIAVAVVVLALGGAVVAVALTRDTAPTTAIPPAGAPVPFSERPAPDERAPLPERTLGGFAGGEPVALADYRGRPLVVNFWASWCGPCLEEMPAFQQVAEETRDEVAFLGVDTRDAPRPAQEFVEDLGITYDLAVDPDYAFAADVGVFALPTTLFVDADGTIVYRATTPLDADGLRAALAEHLGVRSQSPPTAASSTPPIPRATPTVAFVGGGSGPPVR